MTALLAPDVSVPRRGACIIVYPKRERCSRTPKGESTKRKRRLVRPPSHLLLSVFMQYQFADYELDSSQYRLSRHGARIEIEPKVFEVLAYLLQHHDHVVSKDELLNNVWPGQVVSETALSR